MSLYVNGIGHTILSHNQGDVVAPGNTEAPNQAKAASKLSPTARISDKKSANICRIHWLSLTLSALPAEIAQILFDLNLDPQPYGLPMRNHEARYHRLQSFEHGIRLLQTLPEERKQELRLELPGSCFDHLSPSKQRWLLQRLDPHVTSCSRIDLAIDASNSICIDQLEERLTNEFRLKRRGQLTKSLVTRSSSYTTIQSVDGLTLYLGSEDGDHRLRCYSPRAATLRLESQSRGDVAYRRYLALQDALQTITDDQGYLDSIYTFAANAIVSIMDFKTPSSAKQQTSRRPRATWFRKIISTNTKRIKLPPIPQSVIDRRDAKRLDSINRRSYSLSIDKLIAAAFEGSARALIACCRPCPSTLSASQRRMIAQILEAQGTSREQVLAHAA